jgi:hypothetical protein
MTDEFKKTRDEMAIELNNSIYRLEPWIEPPDFDECFKKGWDACHDEILNSAEMKGLMDWLDDNMAPDCDCRQCVLFAAFKARFNVGVGE